MKTRIIVDSTLDMTESFCRRARVIPLTIHFGQEVLTDGVTITRSQFYERLVSVEAMPTTSQPSPAAFEEAYEEISRAGESAVVITISSKLSGTCQSAQIAAEGYDNIYVVDSQNAANGAGILAEYAILCAEKGMAAPELAAHLKEKRNEICVIGVLDTLEYMWKGGRCSGVAALGANVLKLKPCLEMREGNLVVCKKYRGSIEKVYPQYISQRLAGKSVVEDWAFITHSGQVPEETLRELTEQVKAEAPFREVFITQAGCTVSSHCGPKTLGVLFLRKE